MSLFGKLFGSKRKSEVTSGTGASDAPVTGTVDTWVQNVTKDPSGCFSQRVPVRDLTKASSLLFQALNRAGMLAKICVTRFLFSK
jgi:hypothetical protein